MILFILSVIISEDTNVNSKGEGVLMSSFHWLRVCESHITRTRVPQTSLNVDMGHEVCGSAQ